MSNQSGSGTSSAQAGPVRQPIWGDSNRHHPDGIIRQVEPAESASINQQVNRIGGMAMACVEAIHFVVLTEEQVAWMSPWDHPMVQLWLWEMVRTVYRLSSRLGEASGEAYAFREIVVGFLLNAALPPVPAWLMKYLNENGYNISVFTNHWIHPAATTGLFTSVSEMLAYRRRLNFDTRLPRAYGFHGRQANPVGGLPQPLTQYRIVSRLNRSAPFPRPLIRFTGELVPDDAASEPRTYEIGTVIRYASGPLLEVVPQRIAEIRNSLTGFMAALRQSSAQVEHADEPSDSEDTLSAP